MKARILMIEDDVNLAAMVAEYLAESSFDVTTRERALSALDELGKTQFDGVILDVMLPDLDGFEVCRRIRATSNVPILMLTARGDETDRIVGLELGADDYLPKPFNPRELLARIKAIMRRREPVSGQPACDIFAVWSSRDRPRSPKSPDRGQRVSPHLSPVRHIERACGKRGAGAFTRLPYEQRTRNVSRGIRPQHRRSHIENTRGH